MNILMLSCKKASELIDKKSVVKLSLKENVMLKMHTSMCDGCKAYQKQSKILDVLLKHHLQKADETQIPQIINNRLKEQIISKL
ncbi:MAG: hypothetical protein IPI10_03875 [Bacteroidetes bacterium]|nr:hypothetical protein [Bacteroidota bacterium]